MASIFYMGKSYDINGFFNLINSTVTCAAHSGCDSCDCASHSGCDSCDCVSHSGCDSCDCASHSGDHISHFTSSKKHSVVQFQITEVCNHKCSYCFNPYRDNLKHNSWSLDGIGSTIASVAKLTDWLVITGGEPFSKPEILKETLAAAKKYGIHRVSCNTNGTLLEKNILEELKKIDPDLFLFVAVPSLEEFYFEEVTGNQHTHKRLLQGLRNAIEIFGSGNIGTNIVLTKNNLRSIKDTSSQLYGLGVRHFKYSFLSPARISKDLEVKESVLIEEYYSVLRDIRQDYKWESFDSVHAFPLCRIPLDFISGKKSIIKCNMGISTISVDVDGFVSPCPELPPTEFGIPLAEYLVNQDGLISASDCIPPSEEVNEICGACELIQYCGTGCPATRFQHTGSPIGNEALARKMDRDEVHMKKMAIRLSYLDDGKISFSKSSEPGKLIVESNGIAVRNLFVSGDFERKYRLGLISNLERNAFSKSVGAVVASWVHSQ